MPTRTLTRDRCHVRADYEITPACKRAQASTPFFCFFFGGVFLPDFFLPGHLGGSTGEKKAPHCKALSVKLRT